MEYELDHSFLPRLHPQWMSQSTKPTNSDQVYKREVLPDYGGVGIDVVPDANGIKSRVLKHQKAKSNYLATQICLPLQPANPVKYSKDPCLAQIDQLLREQAEFAVKIESIKSNKKFAKTEPLIQSLGRVLRDQLSDEIESTPLYRIPVPANILSAAKKYPKVFPAPLFNWFYSGGCLTLTECEDQKLLLYPGGPKLNNLVSSVLTHVPEKNRFQSILSSRNIDLGGTIHQVVKSPIKDFCVVRQKHFCKVISLKQDERKMSDLSLLADTLQFEDQVSYAALSPFIADELCVTTSNGCCKLYSIENGDLIRDFAITDICKNDTSLEDSTNNFWSCSWGSHPRNIVLMDRHCVGSADLRAKQTMHSIWFDGSSPLRENAEFLSVLKRNPLIDFQHFVGSKRNLFLLDERYPKQPLMAFKHQLKTSPIYIDVATTANLVNNSSCIVSLSTQREPETCLFNLDFSSANPQPTSLTPPFHASQPSDWTKLLELKSYPQSNWLRNRACYSLIGSCLDTTQPDQFTVFLLNSVGDLFYQGYNATDEEHLNEKNYLFGPGLDCKNCDDKLLLDATKEYTALNQDMFARDNCINTTDYTVKDVKNIFEDLNPNLIASDFCPLCHKDTQNEIVLDDNVFCDNCQIDAKQAGELLRSYQKKSVLTNFNDQHVDLNLPESANLSANFDELTSRMLLVWAEPPTNDSENQSYVAENEEQVLRDFQCPGGMTSIAKLPDQTEEISLEHSFNQPITGPKSIMGIPFNLSGQRIEIDDDVDIIESSQTYTRKRTLVSSQSFGGF